MLFESSSTSSTSTSTEELVWFCLRFQRAQPLVRLGESRALHRKVNAGEGSLSKEPSESKAYAVANALVMQAIISLESWLFFFAPKQTTHKLCVSSPVKKRGREEHTAWDATRSCPCLSSLVKVKIKSDNGQTTPNKTDRHRALAEWQKAYTVSIARTLMLPGLYVTPPVTFRPSIGLITRYSERGHSECVPRAFDAARVPEEKCIFTI